MSDQKEDIYIGSDHAGYQLKNQVKPYLEEQGFNVVDLGCFSEEACDYPDIAREVSEKVFEVPKARGVLICGSGIGVCMTANRHRGIRAAVGNDIKDAEMSRRHNDANILCLGGREIDFDHAKQSLDVFFSTEFEGKQEGGERHQRRVEKMDQ